MSTPLGTEHIYLQCPRTSDCRLPLPPVFTLTLTDAQRIKSETDTKTDSAIWFDPKLYTLFLLSCLHTSEERHALWEFLVCPTAIVLCVLGLHSLLWRCTVEITSEFNFGHYQSDTDPCDM